MPNYNSTARVPFAKGGKVKTAKTIPGKWGQKQEIKLSERELERVEDKGVPLVPDFLVKRSIKKRIKKLKSDPKYKEGKKFEKTYEKWMGKYEKGEHYKGGGIALRGLGKAFVKGGKV